MKARETFERIRRQRGNRFGLRSLLMLLVALEMLVCILVAYGIDTLLRSVLFPGWEVPQLAELLLISILMGLLITYFLSRLVFQPIKVLGDAMEKVADGDFSVRLETKSSSQEVQEVYSGFNLMAHELGAMEILQTDFVSNVSHEFKTPINAIEGYSMLLQGGNLDEEQRQYVEKILFNTQRLSSLVGSILLLSKLENQSIPTNQTTYRLDEQIRQSIVALESDWERKEIVFDVEMDRVDYTGSEPLMRHVWDNLLSNAIKFNAQGGMVRMRLTRNPEHIVFTIEDSGPGLTEEAQKHIFDKFYQADSSHREEGNGLGLALVKKILALSGGEISAENIPGGSRFTVTLTAK